GNWNLDLNPTRWRDLKPTCVPLTIVGIGLTVVGWAWWNSPRSGNPTVDATGGSAPSGSGRRSNPFVPEGAVDRGWPFLRGPDFDGRSVEIHLANAWPSTGPPVLWTRPLGQGYSAFTASEDRIFTQYQTLGGQYV